MFLKNKSWTFWLCALCLAGLTASAVPALPRTGTFWGHLRSWTSLFPHSVGVNEVVAGSPAEKIGLEPYDLITAVNGQTFSTAEQFDALIRQIPLESPVELQVKRKTGELLSMVKRGNVTIDLSKQNLEAILAQEKILTLRGASVSPQIEAVMYYDWQFASAAMFAAVAIFVATTVRFRNAWWRPAVVTVVALASLSVIPLVTSPWASTLVWRQWPVDDLPRPWVPLIACPLAGLVVLLLALVHLRAAFQVHRVDGLRQPSQDVGIQ